MDKNSSLIKSEIGIIGAGISGIAAAKELAKHNPIVFKATGSISGVWKHCTFASTRLKTPRCNFEFSDYPWRNRDDPSFLTHLEVLYYVHGYATHFDVMNMSDMTPMWWNYAYVSNRYSSRGPSEEKNSSEYGPMPQGCRLNKNFAIAICDQK